ncbi:mechanosensitive ion channel family protein [Paraburkholderia rhizosphaerae]|uniref:Small-conductance mechanosensitive channel n=1 Tax=Paraburkholderia rhizosphaerae TaxID=480658 RepID=A0A4V6QCZ8_9BURK|nr:mechanosensitive ion channel family protein [Paraburkholderia rhizosphaerae]TDY42449.1 small-conductance mechanosensitive channel [Paraburkholderia rhizosphaerae]
MDHPLIVGYAIVVVDLAVWRFRLPPQEVPRLLSRLVLFAALSYVLFASGLSPFSQAPVFDSVPQHVAGQVLEIIWWLMGARLLGMTLDTLLLPRAWRRQRLFQDVFGALVFLAAVVASLGFVLELPIRGLVATSGALAIVLGLAIQSTLSDVFAGIVLNTTEPYQIGDWVAIDDVEGRVVEMNWRATHLLTSQGNVVIVPNAVAAKTKITNNSRPGALHGVKVSLEISPQERPATVIGALERAVASVTSLMSDPAPYVNAKHSTINSVLYEVTGYVNDMGKKTSVTNELFDLCYRHLASAGVELRSLGVPAAAPMIDDPREALLRRVDLFSTLSRDEIQKLAPLLQRKEYEAGDVLLTKEVVPECLTIVESGILSVTIDEPAGTIELSRLGPGDTMGEQGLLAGMQARVQIAALSRVIVYRLQKDDLTPLLKRNPDVAKQMCELLSRRQDKLSRVSSADAPVSHTEQGLFQWLLDGMRKLHDLTF